MSTVFSCNNVVIFFTVWKKKKKSHPVIPSPVVFSLSCMLAHPCRYTHEFTHSHSSQTPSPLFLTHPASMLLLGSWVFCHANFIPLLHSLLWTMSFSHSSFSSYHGSGYCLPVLTLDTIGPLFPDKFIIPQNIFIFQWINWTHARAARNQK